MPHKLEEILKLDAPTLRWISEWLFNHLKTPHRNLKSPHGAVVEKHDLEIVSQEIRYMADEIEKKCSRSQQ